MHFKVILQVHVDIGTIYGGLMGHFLVKGYCYSPKCNVRAHEWNDAAVASDVEVRSSQRTVMDLMYLRKGCWCGLVVWKEATCRAGWRKHLPLLVWTCLLGACHILPCDVSDEVISWVHMGAGSHWDDVGKAAGDVIVAQLKSEQIFTVKLHL